MGAGSSLIVILRGGAGYELIYITNEAVGRVGYYQVISGKSEKNNCFSKFKQFFWFFWVKPLQSVIFSLPKWPRKNFPTSKISEQEIRPQFFLIWSNLTIMAFSINLLVVYRESVNLIGYLTRRLSADSLQLWITNENQLFCLKPLNCRCKHDKTFFS